MDSSGNVTYSRIKDNASGKLVPLSSNAKDLMEAIDDHSIFVTVIASDNYVSTRNTIIPGGAFMGNRVTNRSVYSRSAYVRIVETQQEIVDSTLRKIDSIFNRPGSCMIHEVLESYEGGKISQEAGESSPRSDGPGTVYDEAHRRSTTQHGHFEQECYDKLGKKQEEFNRDTTWKVLFYVKNKGKRILVQTSYNK
jgi:hypothetical protein